MITAPNFHRSFLVFKTLKELNSGCDNSDKTLSIFEVTIRTFFIDSLREIVLDNYIAGNSYIQVVRPHKKI